MEKGEGLRVPWSRVHLIGAGGVGMAGIGLILREAGVGVSGSDAAASSYVERLRAAGAKIQVGHEAAHLGDAERVIYSSAIPPTNPEWQAAQGRELPCQRRGDFLADLAPYFRQVVSIAGSHGKTTVTAMLAHLLRRCGHDAGYLVGGEWPDGRPTATAGDGSLLITEVDESDGTQARMRSTIGIVVNVDDDHCWSVGGVEALHDCFRIFAQRAEQLIAWEAPATRELFADHPAVTWIDDDDVPADAALAVPGQHNRLDATLAVAAATRLGVESAAGWAALRSFPGVERRLSLRAEIGGMRVIEDYAHHPVELRASLAALREAWPDGRLRIVFQPHRYERIARYSADFARELSAADEVIVTEPFQAWVDDAGLADPAAIAEQVSGIPSRFSRAPYAELARDLAQSARSGDSMAVIGAGTITQLVPLLIAQLEEAHRG